MDDAAIRHEGGGEGIIDEEIIIGDERIDDGDDVNEDEEEIASGKSEAPS